MYHKERLLDIIIFYLPKDVPLTECEELLPTGHWQMVRTNNNYKIRNVAYLEFMYTANQLDVDKILEVLYHTIT